VLDVREEPLTVTEMAEYLKVSEYTVREYAKNRKVPAHKVGGVWRFYLSEFRASRTAAVVDPWVRDDKRRRGKAA
jgi:excisionase family DNA binding protein